ncbi:DUF2178 domain-containing protein [Candidatus Enterococcus lemimoniae]|uniref:DUF2178 domain-containing protein n=1 Tax=Candidatus Enterococcus lemimoniae TaxID=1834167 RepID=A0ABZ2T5H4_9ENTE
MMNKFIGFSFKALNEWSEKSIGNYNLLIGIGFILVMISSITLVYLLIKLGQTDERTTKIHLNVCCIMLVTIVLCDLFFPKEYMQNILFLFKYALAFCISLIYLFKKYKQDLR